MKSGDDALSYALAFGAVAIGVMLLAFGIAVAMDVYYTAGTTPPTHFECEKVTP